MVWVIAGLRIKSFKFSIRRKLLIILAVLLVVPWIGVQYIQDMENFLRENQQENLLGRAQVVAAVLQGQDELFKSRTVSGAQTDRREKTINNPSHYYVRPLKRAMQLDGYIDDWLDFDIKSILVKSNESNETQFRYMLASYRKHIYLVLKVKDERLVYRKANSLSLDKNDHLIIKLRNKEGELKTYYIATQSPGWVNAQRMELLQNGWQSVAPEYRIKGEWQETEDGYIIELRLPLSLIGDDFSFYVADVNDAQSREIETVSGESKITDNLGTIIIPSVKVEAMLKRIIRPASRTWVIDKKYRVLAVADDIKNEVPLSNINSAQKETGIFKNMVSLFYNFFLKQPTQNFKDELSSASYLRGEVVQSALQGTPSTSWRDTPDKQVRILTVSYPVVINGEPVGAIAIEETSNAILILQNRAMEIVINLSVLTFFITLVVLLSYATRLSIRIRRLRDEAEQAISDEGRIESAFSITNSSDEIGDLSRSFTEMLARLGEYNRYLESMAGKLSHELRTPITVVRSSLENLQMAKSDEQRERYILRASEGMSRLNDILSRMSEATRLEQTLQSETLENVNPGQLVGRCVEGYKLAYPEVNFIIEIDCADRCEITGVPDLLAQMLDKLVSNAVDFHTHSTPIVLSVKQQKNTIQLSVINQGRFLPDEMRDNLFESMVSVRHKKGDQPHLGLGLYIVRLIVEFHNGSVRAVNLTNKSGVEILIEFPRGDT
jgi:two-component system, OmpR family, sensor histidine kinase ChvG